MQAAEHREGNDVGSPGFCRNDTDGRLWHGLADPLMWPCPIEVPDILREHAAEVLLAQDQHVVQAFAAHAAEPALAHRGGALVL